MEAAETTQQTELIQAVLRRDEAAVRAALAAGAPLALHGVTALHAAALSDCSSVVPLLVDAGEPHCVLPGLQAAYCTLT